MLLAGRVRHGSEAAEIVEVLESAFKCKVDPHTLFTISNSADGVHENRRISCQPQTWPLLKQITNTLPCGFENVVWTFSMRRMALMVEQALRFGEPVLLVGETGYVFANHLNLLDVIRDGHCATILVHIITFVPLSAVCSILHSQCFVKNFLS
jgi:midasin